MFSADSERLPASRWARLLRWWIPAALCLVGVALMVADNFDTFGVSAFAGSFAGAGSSTWLINWLWRLGVSGDDERDREGQERVFLAAHARWPTQSGAPLSRRARPLARRAGRRLGRPKQTPDHPEWLLCLTMSDANPEVRKRLLKAWRGEIQARASYELIAKRLPPREAEIMGRMADAEASTADASRRACASSGSRSRRRSSVRLSRWVRLQARIAPIDRLLAAREAAEDDEVDELYKRSTGDTTTDQLLHEIRKDERSHSMAVTGDARR